MCKWASPGVFLRPRGPPCREGTRLSFGRPSLSLLPSPPRGFAFIPLTASSDRRPAASLRTLVVLARVSQSPSGRVATGHGRSSESGSGHVHTSASLSPPAHCDSSSVVPGGWLAAPVQSLPSLKTEGTAGGSRRPGLVYSFGLLGP